MINFIQKGKRLAFANISGSTIAGGTGVLVGTKLGVAEADMPDGTSGALCMIGVVNLPKLSTDVVAQGAALYWDNTNHRLTTTASGNTYAGYAFDAAGNGAATVNIHLNI